jgi:hypothetical protein
MVFLCPSRQLLGENLKTGHDRLHPHLRLNHLQINPLIWHYVTYAVDTQPLIKND